MPGPISDSYGGPDDRCPYVPHWCYPNNAPRMCPCGHHEGYHNDAGKCSQCACGGIPADCVTSDADFYGHEEPDHD